MAEARDTQVVSPEVAAYDVTHYEAYSDIIHDNTGGVENNRACDVIKDAREFVKDIIRRNRIKLKKDLKPEEVLDVFLQETFFGDVTEICVRDIREQRTTSEKNDKIIDAAARSPGKYIIFKTSLALTGQEELLECVESTEKTIHEEKKGNFGSHVCTDASQCPSIAKLKCPVNTKPLVPKELLDIRNILLSAYEGMFQRIPIFPEKTLDLDELYVEQDFKLIDNGRQANGNTGELSGISAVEDIFHKNGKICKNILICAEPGTGKSTFCQHLVRLWCKGHTLDEATLTKDQETLKGFKLLFYIDLKDAAIPPIAPKCDEIAKLVHEHLELADKCSLEDIRKVLSDISTLVVMDSLDELGARRLPRRGLHNKSCVVTTSRPWKIEALRSQLTDVDHHIEIVGLAKASPSSLANNVLKLLNTGSEESQKKSGDQFIQDMNTKELYHFFNTPLLFIQMLGLWFSGESFGDSQFEIYSKVIHHQILTALNTKELPEYVGNSSKRNFPSCNSSDQCPCKDYGELLWKVAKLAYHTLFNKEKEMCLVFNHEITKLYGLSTKEVELCLKTGILTQHKLLVKNPTEQKKSVSFPHKTNQEYFASIFLSYTSKGQLSDLDHIQSVTINLDLALELDKIILFCSHLDRISNADVARQLSYIISVKADEDHRVQKYRQSCDEFYAPHHELIEKIQAIIIPATKQNDILCLSDVVFENAKRLRSGNKFLNIDIRRLDPTCIKSMHVDIFPLTSDVLDMLKQFKRLQKLVLYNRGINVEIIHEMTVKNKNTLETLGLYGGVWPLDMSPLAEKFRDTFTPKLSSLALSNVKLSHQQTHILSKFVSSSHILRQVELSYLLCETHGKIDQCFVLDFTRHESLQSIMLWILPLVDLRLNLQTLEKFVFNLPEKLAAQSSVIKSLESARNLRELTCHSIKYAQQLVRVLPQLHRLQILVLRDIDFGHLCHIRLSNTMEKLESVKLRVCTITAEGLESIVGSLPRHRVTVNLWRVTVKGGDNIFNQIRNASNTEVTLDAVQEVTDGWRANFTFDNHVGL